MILVSVYLSSYELIYRNRSNLTNSLYYFLSQRVIFSCPTPLYCLSAPKRHDVPIQWSVSSLGYLLQGYPIHPLSYHMYCFDNDHVVSVGRSITTVISSIIFSSIDCCNCLRIVSICCCILSNISIDFC